MNIWRLLLRLAYGSRRPITSGELRITGLSQPVTIRRDKHGVPSIQAETDADAYFALGFVQAQDRGFQLETQLRVVRGTMAAMVGHKALPLDRISRRIGFSRSAQDQLPVLDADIRENLDAFVAGITAGYTRGSSNLPHEFALLKSAPSIWTPADVLGIVKLQTFLLPSNWDVELARLQILRADGPDAMLAVDPASPELADRSGSTFRELSNDLAMFTMLLGRGGGSNNWTIASERTSTGKPILANDPHLAPSLPNPWYLAHVNTPTWAVAGAMLVGGPVFPCGHTDTICWGVTAGLTDNTDWVITSPDDPHTIVDEVIHLADGADVIERVPITPHGPVVSQQGNEWLALRAVWLQNLPVRGFFDSPKAQTFEEFRKPFAAWPAMPLNVVYADTHGTIGYQLIGQLPQRNGCSGTIPLPANASQWNGLLPFEQMPFTVNPSSGFLATANDPNGRVGGGDALDDYRSEAIRAALRASTTWSVDQCRELQRSQKSLVWEQIRPHIVNLLASDADAELGLTLLREWDGVVAADSPAATVFELFLSELCQRVAKAKAPKSWAVVLGGGLQLAPFTHSMFAERRAGHLAKLLIARPDGWWSRSWDEELLDALRSVVNTLRMKHGPAPAFWQWGDLRQLKLEHSLLGKTWLGRVFNVGPVPIGGDCNTIAQAGSRPADPLANTHTIANLRVVFDTANWSNSRYVLAGGQSGNPLSANFSDQFELWQTGDAISIAWSADEVIRSAVASLRLTPG